MLLVDEQKLREFENDYAGIGDTIRYFENLAVPSCPACGSSDTASVQVGIIGRTIRLSLATSKFKLLANRSLPETCFCNACSKYFD